MGAEGEIVNNVYKATIQGTTIEHLMYRLEEWLPQYRVDSRNPSRSGRETIYSSHRNEERHTIIVDLVQPTDTTIILTIIVATITQPDQESKLIDRLNIWLK